MVAPPVPKPVPHYMGYAYVERRPVDDHHPVFLRIDSLVGATEDGTVITTWFTRELARELAAQLLEAAR